ncbi:hypothetical protein CU669_18235 [Paramagnetospirillum kuznetsovii]|uniref:Uncharacterized protein n=1 Tax=Paramagnetospirillum kuznetsovii TaxID=2053833 RepID=A0A364NTR9_9PROT|nr:hypothetical protein CU669_18235 [Paramagnetospirillum kuznetsovii]
MQAIEGAAADVVAVIQSGGCQLGADFVAIGLAIMKLFQRRGTDAIRSACPGAWKFTGIGASRGIGDLLLNGIDVRLEALYLGVESVHLCLLDRYGPIGGAGRRAGDFIVQSLPGDLGIELGIGQVGLLLLQLDLILKFVELLGPARLRHGHGVDGYASSGLEGLHHLDLAFDLRLEAEAGALAEQVAQIGDFIAAIIDQRLAGEDLRIADLDGGWLLRAAFVDAVHREGIRILIAARQYSRPSGEA